MNFNIPTAAAQPIPHDELRLTSSYAHACLEVSKPIGVVTWFVNGQEIPKSRAKNVSGVHVHARQEMIYIIPNKPDEIPDLLSVTAKDDLESITMNVRVTRDQPK